MNNAARFFNRIKKILQKKLKLNWFRNVKKIQISKFIWKSCIWIVIPPSRFEWRESNPPSQGFESSVLQLCHLGKVATSTSNRFSQKIGPPRTKVSINGLVTLVSTPNLIWKPWSKLHFKAHLQVQFYNAILECDFALSPWKRPRLSFKGPTAAKKRRSAFQNPTCKWPFSYVAFCYREMPAYHFDFFKRSPLHYQSIKKTWGQCYKTFLSVIYGFLH